MRRLLFSPERHLPLVGKKSNNTKDVDPNTDVVEEEMKHLPLTEIPHREHSQLQLRSANHVRNKYISHTTSCKAPRPPGTHAASTQCASYDGAYFIHSGQVYRPQVRHGRFVRKTTEQRKFGADITNVAKHKPTETNLETVPPLENILASPGIVAKPTGNVIYGNNFISPASPEPITSEEARQESGTTKNQSTYDLAVSRFSEFRMENVNKEDVFKSTKNWARPKRPQRPSGKKESSLCRVPTLKSLSFENSNGSFNPREKRVRSRRSKKGLKEVYDVVCPLNCSHICSSISPVESRQNCRVETFVVPSNGIDSVESTTHINTPATPSAANYKSPQPYVHQSLAKTPSAIPQLQEYRHDVPSFNDVDNLLQDLDEIERRVANRRTPIPSPCPGVEPGSDSPTESILRMHMSKDCGNTPVVDEPSLSPDEEIFVSWESLSQKDRQSIESQLKKDREMFAVVTQEVNSDTLSESVERDCLNQESPLRCLINGHLGRLINTVAHMNEVGASLELSSTSFCGSTKRAIATNSVSSPDIRRHGTVASISEGEPAQTLHEPVQEDFDRDVLCAGNEGSYIFGNPLFDNVSAPIASNLEVVEDTTKRKADESNKLNENVYSCNCTLRSLERNKDISLNQTKDPKFDEHKIEMKLAIIPEEQQMFLLHGSKTSSS